MFFFPIGREGETLLAIECREHCCSSDSKLTNAQKACPSRERKIGDLKQSRRFRVESRTADSD